MTSGIQTAPAGLLSENPPSLPGPVYCSMCRDHSLDIRMQSKLQALFSEAVQHGPGKTDGEGGSVSGKFNFDESQDRSHAASETFRCYQP